MNFFEPFDLVLIWLGGGLLHLRYAITDFARRNYYLAAVAVWSAFIWPLYAVWSLIAELKEIRSNDYE